MNLLEFLKSCQLHDDDCHGLKNERKASENRKPFQDITIDRIGEA
jgi:hypothetical protein